MFVGFFDQLDFPTPFPALQAAFHLRRLRHRIVSFEPDQHVALIFRRETRANALFVLADARRKVGCGADIERTISAIGHDVGGDKVEPGHGILSRPDNRVGEDGAGVNLFLRRLIAGLTRPNPTGFALSYSARHDHSSLSSGSLPTSAGLFLAGPVL